MKVARFCKLNLVTAEVTDTLREAAGKMIRSHVGALAVLDEGGLAGVLSEGDLVTAAAEQARFDTTLVQEYMTEGPVTVTLDDDASVALRRMTQHGVHHLPVLDGDRPVGMVSVRDLLDILAVNVRD